jgi:hypothetical protein
MARPLCSLSSGTRLTEAAAAEFSLARKATQAHGAWGVAVNGTIHLAQEAFALDEEAREALRALRAANGGGADNDGACAYAQVCTRVRLGIRMKAVGTRQCALALHPKCCAGQSAHALLQSRVVATLPATSPCARPSPCASVPSSPFAALRACTPTPPPPSATGGRPRIRGGCHRGRAANGGTRRQAPSLRCSVPVPSQVRARPRKLFAPTRSSVLA